jgi:hypothetical protein
MDHFQVLKQSTIQSIFEEEYQWMKDKRWWLAENNQANMLLLPDADKMSLHHLNQVLQWIQAERNEIAKKLEDEQRKKRDPSQLVGSHGGY